jgi:dTMP kinase
MIIVFSGTDGAGKSTQIEQLMSAYKEQGYSVKYVWARGGYTPLFSWAKGVARKLLRKKLPAAGQSKAREKILKKGPVSRLWLGIATVDLILLYAVYVRGLSLFGRVVVCDRYIEDTGLDFIHNFGESFKPDGFLWRMLQWLAPRPDYAFLLTVPVDVSLHRSKLKNEPFPDSPETLHWRLDQYMNESIFPADVFIKIECQQPVEAIQEMIQQRVLERTRS